MTCRPEQAVQKSIAYWLRKNGFLFTAPDAGINIKSKKTRMDYKAMGRTSGIADLIVWIPNGTVCIEVKRPKVYGVSCKTGNMIIIDEGGKQSEEQKLFEKRVNELGGHYYLVAQSDADVREFFIKNNLIQKNVMWINLKN